MQHKYLEVTNGYSLLQARMFCLIKLVLLKVFMGRIGQVIQTQKVSGEDYGKLNKTYGLNVAKRLHVCYYLLVRTNSMSIQGKNLRAAKYTIFCFGGVIILSA